MEKLPLEQLLGTTPNERQLRNKYQEGKIIMKGHIYYKIDPTGEKVIELYHTVLGIDEALDRKIGANVAKLLAGKLHNTHMIAGWYWWRLPMKHDYIRYPKRGKKQALKEIRRFILREKLKRLAEITTDPKFKADEIIKFEKVIDEMITRT